MSLGRHIDRVVSIFSTQGTGWLHEKFNFFSCVPEDVMDIMVLLDLSRRRSPGPASVSDLQELLPRLCASLSAKIFAAARNDPQRVAQHLMAVRPE